MSVRVVLWDADGVLQRVPGTWSGLLAGAVGEEGTRALLATLWPVAQEAIRGRADIEAELDRVVTDLGLQAAREPIREIWGTIEALPESRDLVAELRAAGVACHLATNQDPLRASYMRARMGYDGLLDGAFYSCDLGVAKPDPAFFETVLARLGASPAEVAFVDDTEANVTAADVLGLHALHWHHDQGIPALRDLLGSVGLGV